jgi:hypothetical protein
LLQGEAKMEAAALNAQLDEQSAAFKQHVQEKQDARLQIQLLQQELASTQVGPGHALDGPMQDGAHPPCGLPAFAASC